MLAVVWHYWMGAVLSAVVILSVVAMIAGYLRSVESTRYPKGR
jgi:hypothetical protein